MKVFQLQNKNNLICSEKGIFLSEQGMTNINVGIIFDSEISRDDFSFLTIAQFEEGEKYIIVAYKTMIYIFNSEGKFFLETTIDFTPGESYYTLVPYQLDTNSNEYYFIIGYIDGINFLIASYNFNNESGIIESVYPIYLTTKYQITSTSRGFSCQIMQTNNNEKFLTCFFRNSNDLLISSFNLENFLNLADLTHIISSVNPINILSTISSDKTKALVCYLKEYQYGRCDIYDITNNDITIIYANVDNTFECNNGNFLNTMIYRSINSEKFFYGCFGYNNNFNLIRFDSDFSFESDNINVQYIIENCNCLTFTIVETINDNDYFLLASCQNDEIVVYDELPEDGQGKTIEINDEESIDIIPSDLEPFPSAELSNQTNLNPEINNYSEIIKYYSEINIKSDSEININTNISTNFQNQIDFTNLIANPTQKYFFSTNLIQEKSSNFIMNNLTSIEYTTIITCSEEYLYQNIETKECLNFCNTEDLLSNKCKINIVTNSNINNFTQNVRNIIFQNNLTSETNIVIEGQNTIYQIISSTEMASNMETNMSVIDLGDCEKELLEENNLDYLLILKIDTKIDDETAIILNYEIYNPLTNDKLNLSLCSNMKIYTYSSYYPSQESLSKINKLSEYGYDLYNINDDFYQDICASFTSDNGTDILLSDRRNDYYENVSLCENDCVYVGYNLSSKRVQCECPIKEEIKINNTENKNIIENFFGGSNFSNLKLLKCYKLVFSKNGQKDNKGSIIFLCILFSIIILGIIYLVKKEDYIIKNIRKINNEKYKETEKDKEKEKEKGKEKEKKIKSSYKKYVSNTVSNINSKAKDILSFPPKKKNKKLNKNKDKKVKIFDFRENNNNQNISNSASNLKQVNEKNSEKKKVVYFKTEVDKEKEIQYEIYNFTNEELNSLSYEMALRYDKRTYFKYYISLLKQKHLIIFTFFNNEDYNIFVLKLSLFLSSFALYFTVNAIFFTDDTMHDIYKKNGNQNIISQISNIFYSTIISCFINIIIKRLGLSYNDMVRIKQIPDETECMKASTLLLKKLKIKFGIFFIIIFILDSFFWYFISAFCSVYKNTQVILIENTLSSYGLSLLYPLGLNLIPGLLRIPSLKKFSKSSKYMFFCSKIIALI